MSEEKPNFKITDRRLFNPDGSPREVEREEPAPAPAPDAAAPSAAEVADLHASPAGESAGGEGGTASGAGGPSGGAAASGAAQGPADEEEDPQEFLMVVEFIASFAADALGMVNHPGGEGRDVNPPLAKQCIDMLGTLQRKTRGNLTEEEQHFFELILSQLRMQYVSLTGAGRAGGARGAGRGFTGGDITGGR